MAKTKNSMYVNRLHTGSDLLDIVVGGGLGSGFPPGKIINIVGDKSSGKTFLACELIASAYYRYSKKFRWIYDDGESGFTFDTKSLYGVEIMPEKSEDRIKSRTVEDLYCNVRTFLEKLKDDEVGIYVIDSLDGVGSKEMEKRADKRYKAIRAGKEFDEGSYQMGKPKFLSQEFFPGLAELIEKKNALVIVISQTRTAIGSMFKSQTRAGGKALDFYSHTALWLSQVTKIKKKDRVIGIVLKAHTKKSKTPRPFRNCLLSLFFDYGVDNIGTNLDYLFDLRGDSGVLLTKANSIIWQGEDITVSNLKSFLEENKKLEEYKKAYKVVKKSDMIVFIESDEKLLKLYLDKFGSAMSRDELINYIEENKLEVRLRERVVEKWEKIEKEIATNRKPKYQKS